MDAKEQTALPRADAAAWFAVAAGTIGSLMATLDISIVNSALPTIQGAIGASGSEGTWISTAYLVAEIIMIPLSGWFERMLGLRRFLLLATCLFVVFSLWCGLAGSLGVMIIGRVGQGFTGGAMIPTAMTIVATRLPPRQQPIGMALFGMTAVLGPVVGPILGGWLTDTIGWHYSFFINLPIGAVLIVLLVLGLKAARPNWTEFFKADWLGVVGLSLGLGGLTIVLEDGQREQWFESDLIRCLALASLIGFGLIFWGQRVARRPVISLAIIAQRQFGSVFLMSLTIGAALYGILFIIPQYLAIVPGYTAGQCGAIAAISGVPTIIMLALFPILVRRIDLRLAVGFGLVLYAVGCFWDSNLTAESAGAQFFWSQAVRGFGQFFTLVFLNQAATNSVPPQLAEDASGLFNAARNLGGSLGLAAVTVLQDQRTTFHAARLSEAVTANSLLTQEVVRDHGEAGFLGIAQSIQLQSMVMMFADLFWVFGVALILILPLSLLLRPLPKNFQATLHA
jgi:DHA2 family multidrug resistance protein